MSTEENKAIARRVFDEAWTKGNLDILDEIATADTIAHLPGSPEPSRGVEAVKTFMRTYRSAFPDLSMTIEEQIAEGDKVMTRWTAIGTHEGELMGIAPTGKQATVSGVTIHRFAGGKIVEGRGMFDALGLLQQIGAAPVPTRA